MYSLEMPSSCAKLLSLRIELFIPVLSTTFPPPWLTQRLQQPLDLIIRWMRCDCPILESNFLNQSKPMDLLALQADWVDDYCPEDEGPGEHKQEEKDDNSVEDEKEDLERVASSSIYTHLNGPDVPA